MLKKPSWLLVGLLVLCSALGTFPSREGAYLFLVTIGTAVLLRYVAKWEDHK